LQRQGYIDAIRFIWIANKEEKTRGLAELSHEEKPKEECIKTMSI